MIGFLEWLDGVLWGLPLIVLILGTGIYFTIRSGFFQFRHFGYVMKRTAGRIFEKKEAKQESDKNSKGMLSAFQAIAVAVGGTVGFGNIAGVATAVVAGGPGAIFWMWIAASLGLIIKQVEVTLGCYYRRSNESGDYYGGPTYYMEKGLGEERHWGKLWLIPAIIFAVGIFSTYFVSSSTLTAAQVMTGVFGVGTAAVGGFEIEGEIICGVALCIVTYLVSIGGTKSIANVFTKLVPIMSILYMIMGIAMIVVHLPSVPAAVISIFTSAFTGEAAIGGFAGATVSQMIRVGMARSVYSNEAGWGTSPMIHGSARTRHPVEQGLWGTFEVFFDTFIVCTITGLSVILSGTWTDGTTGGTQAIGAFTTSFGSFGGVLLAIIMVVFTVTTSGGWFTYYLAILEHMYKKDGPVKRIVMKVFYACRCLPALIWLIYLVKTNNQGFIWTLVDITSAVPTFINVAVILILSNQYFRLLRDYKGRYMGIGKADPSEAIFYEDKVRS
ncbi:MAG: amino acid carrier protein [Clostridiales bacterium]|nr:amino acid carrier protein [Clostridiales bacterium]